MMNYYKLFTPSLDPVTWYAKPHAKVSYRNPEDLRVLEGGWLSEWHENPEMWVEYEENGYLKHHFAWVIVDKNQINRQEKMHNITLINTDKD